MTCEHIKRAKQKINDFINKINNNNPTVCEKIGPYIECEKLEKELNRMDVVRNERDSAVFSVKLALFLVSSSKTEYRITYDGLDAFSSGIFDELKNCDCLEDIEDSLDLAEKAKNILERERNEWKDRFDSKNIENETNKDELAKYKNKELKWTKTEGEQKTKIATLETDLRNSETRNTALEKRAENSERDRDLQVKEWKGKYEESEKEVKKLTNSFNSLQIENNNKDNQIRQKDEEINLLKNQAELSQEELLKLKIRFEERKLEQFVVGLKINLEQLNSLSEFHEKLFSAQKEHNQENIINQKANIAQLKQKLLDKEISIINIQEICDKCEKIAEFSWELSQTNRIQLIDNNQGKDWKNINSNFTPELVQEWIKHGFTYKQCQEWVNIHSPEQQNISIKEPAYYSWLREIKKMKPEEVLNYEDSQVLNREFLKWYQEQEQQQFEAQQEIPTNN